MKYLIALTILSIIFLAGCTTNTPPGTTTVQLYDKESCEKIGGYWKNNACAMQGNINPTTVAQTGGGGLVSVEYYQKIRNITDPDECRRMTAVWRDCADGTCTPGCFPPPNA